jgi:hypothetical protein
LEACLELRGQRRIRPSQIARAGINAAGGIDAIHITDAHAPAPCKFDRQTQNGWEEKEICVTTVRQQEGDDVRQVNAIVSS